MCRYSARAENRTARRICLLNGATSLSNFNAPSGITISQSTGVTYPGSASGTVSAIHIAGYGSVPQYGMSFATAIPNEAIIAETNAQNLNNPSDMGYVSIVNNPTVTSITNAQSVDMGFSSSYFSNDYLSSSAQSVDLNQQGSANTNWNYGSTTYFGSTASSYTGYIAPQLYSGGYAGTVTVNPLSSATNLYLGLIGSASASYPWDENINWMRARSYPPAGQMPSATYGSVQTAAFNSPYYITITLTNSQSSAASGPFQQLIDINSNEYQKYITPGWTNVEFTTGPAGTGTVLNSWVESGATNLATSTEVWVKIPGGVPTGTSQIYMDFLTTNTLYGGTAPTSAVTGFAPTLSSTYGANDNGASVFNFYDNFAGTISNACTGPPSGFTASCPSGTITMSESNGFTISTGTSTYGGLIYNTGLTPPFVYEADITSISGVAAGTMLQSGSSASSTGYGFNYWSGSVSAGSMSGGFAGPSNPNLQMTTGVMGQAWTSSSSQTYYKNYVGTSGSATTYSEPNPMYLSLGMYSDSPSSSMTVQWIRTRTYPPSGVMPSYSLSQIQ